jgi:Protease inhibitor Inh
MRWGHGWRVLAVSVCVCAGARAAAPADAAGRYSILRDGGKDTGCMLTLDNQAKATGRKKASLAPGCRDQGIVIFDPVGWQIVGGHLVLTARKGHKTHLDAQPDGTWKKDPKEGKGLTLKKL